MTDPLSLTLFVVVAGSGTQIGSHQHNPLRVLYCGSFPNLRLIRQVRLWSILEAMLRPISKANQIFHRDIIVRLNSSQRDIKS